MIDNMDVRQNVWNSKEPNEPDIHVASSVFIWFKTFADHCLCFVYDSLSFFQIRLFALSQLCLPMFGQVNDFDQVKESA